MRLLQVPPYYLVSSEMSYYDVRNRTVCRTCTGEAGRRDIRGLRIGSAVPGDGEEILSLEIYSGVLEEQFVLNLFWEEYNPQSVFSGEGTSRPRCNTENLRSRCWNCRPSEREHRMHNTRSGDSLHRLWRHREAGCRDFLSREEEIGVEF